MDLGKGGGGVRIGRENWTGCEEEKKNERVRRSRRLDKRSFLSPPPPLAPSLLLLSLSISLPTSSSPYPPFGPAFPPPAIPSDQAEHDNAAARRRSSTPLPAIELSLAVGPYNPARPRSFESVHADQETSTGRREGGKEMNSDGLMRWQEYQR